MEIERKPVPGSGFGLVHLVTHPAHQVVRPVVHIVTAVRRVTKKAIPAATPNTIPTVTHSQM